MYTKKDIQDALRVIALCELCGVSIEAVTQTDTATRQNYADADGNLTCKGTWDFHKPAVSKPVRGWMGTRGQFDPGD